MMLGITLAMVATKPGHQGEREGNRKTIAQGMPVEPGKPVATTRCIFCTNHGCIGHPAFPVPSYFLGRAKLHASGESVSRERGAIFDCHCERSEAIQCDEEGLDCFVASAPRNDDGR
jgi:hypothetical protein